jgi:hypothetical protein
VHIIFVLAVYVLSGELVCVGVLGFGGQMVRE